MSQSEQAQRSTRGPIFIVGCQRSGTTLLRLILDSHPNISCGPETRFLEDLAKVTREPFWPHMAQYGFPKEYWFAQFGAMFDSFQRDYAERRGKARWADKTPRYALCLDFITQAFPTCQVVHVIRDGRDVVASHRDRFGWWSAVKSIKKWPLYIETARKAGAALPADRYYEIRYEALVGDTEGSLRKLLDFLGEPWDDAVLEHDRHPHDVPSKYQQFTASRRTATKERTAIYRSRAGAGGKKLNPLLRMLFMLISARTLHDLGYR